MKDCFGLHGHSAFGYVAKRQIGVGQQSLLPQVQLTDPSHWLQAGKTVDILRCAAESTDLLLPSALLRGLCFDAELLVPEEDDISLAERCRRVNTWCQVHGKENAICVSIHFNAFGNGSAWTSPSGWSIYTSVGNTTADRLADCIAKAAAAHLPSMKLRGEWSDGDIDYEEGFYLMRHTLCPCVLTENGFMTNEQECHWLMTEEAIESIAMTHEDGIANFMIQQ